MNIGIKISRTGDILTATDDALVLTSSYPVMKISDKASPAHFDTYTHTFSSNPSVGITVLKTVAHGLSVTPVALVYVIDHQDSDKYATLPQYIGAPIYIHYYTDATNLIIYLNKTEEADLTGYSYTFKYYIFQENLV